MAARVRIKYRLEDMAGEPCLIVRYDLVTPELFRDVGARAVFISGNSAAATDYEAEDQAGLRAAIAARAWASNVSSFKSSCALTIDGRMRTTRKETRKQSRFMGMSSGANPHFRQGRTRKVPSSSVLSDLFPALAGSR